VNYYLFHWKVAQEAQEIKRDLLNFDELRNQELYFYPSKNNIYIEQYRDWFIIHSPFGNKINDALSRLISQYCRKIWDCCWDKNRSL